MIFQGKSHSSEKALVETGPTNRTPAFALWNETALCHIETNVPWKTPLLPVPGNATGLSTARTAMHLTGSRPLAPFCREAGK